MYKGMDLVVSAEALAADELGALEGLPVEVRLARARDPESSEDVLRHLSKDGFWFVRDYVASNPSTPKDCLEKLMRDDDFRVRTEAKKNYKGENGMTDPKIVKYIDTYCVKNGDIEVKGITGDGRYTLVVPVFNGEEGENQIATLDMEFSYDGDDVILYHFPKNLLDGDDYITITEEIYGYLRENVPGIMLQEALQERIENPYEKQNDYYAWRKPDGSLFMLGMECYQANHILKYELDPVSKDYGARFYSIDPHAVHRRGPHHYDPVQELISQVVKYEYLGHWRDPAIFMETESGRVAAYGRWEEAKAHISASAERMPSSDLKDPGKAYACNGVPIFDGYGGIMNEEDAERLEESWERAENYAMGRTLGYMEFDDRAATCSNVFWLDKDTLVYSFGPFADQEGDEYHVDCEYWLGDNSWHAVKVYDEQVVPVAFEGLPVEQRERIINKMKQDGGLPIGEREGSLDALIEAAEPYAGVVQEIDAGRETTRER